jgi:hypothetical protein
MTDTGQPDAVERWGCFELALHGPADDNAFLEVPLRARFRHKHREIEVDGFYDGAGVYQVRFMPDAEGEWRYVTASARPTLDGVRGELRCLPAGEGNRGPVRVHDRFHFAYADGTPYVQVGTTCYAWTHQGDALEAQTLATLAAAPFNKLRMCVFPKHYAYNENEPERYPFPCLARGSSTWTGSYAVDIKEGWAFDVSRFEPAFFRHFEQRVRELQRLGIEADVILFHPYDRWGFATLDADTDDRYLRYVVARLAAFRNVWWSMANEYDLLPNKSLADWDRFFRIVQEHDPYGHLRSIHNCRGFYDHAKPWVTHASVQHSDLGRVAEWRAQYGKPVVVDECCYEGDVEQGWGNISARELVHRFWLGTVGGGYVGHGETYRRPDDVLWWAKGGALHGASPPRLAFLRELLERAPHGLEPLGRHVAGRAGEYYLYYFGVHQPGVLTLDLPPGQRYAAQLIDPWEMTAAPLGEQLEGRCALELPGRPYLAVSARRLS